MCVADCVQAWIRDNNLYFRRQEFIQRNFNQKRMNGVSALYTAVVMSIVFVYLLDGVFC